MNKENTEKLFNDFPELYRQHTLTIYESCMPWGFECTDMWFDIIYRLSKRITDYCKEKNMPVIEAEQVKEKFGSLSFYVNKADAEVYRFINESEKETEKICAKCGSKENISSTSGWITYLCEDCYK